MVSKGQCWTCVAYATVLSNSAYPQGITCYFVYGDFCVSLHLMYISNLDAKPVLQYQSAFPFLATGERNNLYMFL